MHSHRWVVKNTHAAIAVAGYWAASSAVGVRPVCFCPSMAHASAAMPDLRAAPKAQSCGAGFVFHPTDPDPKPTDDVPDGGAMRPLVAVWPSTVPESLAANG